MTRKMKVTFQVVAGHVTYYVDRDDCKILQELIERFKK